MKTIICKDCGDVFMASPSAHRLYCDPCKRLRQYELIKDWRQRNRERMRAMEQRRARKLGRTPRDRFDADRRTATLERAKRIAALLQQGLTCSQAAERLGTTKNAVIGVMDRARRYGYLGTDAR